MAPAIDPVADAGLVTGTWRDPPIVITAARFTQRNGSYTVTVSGSGFGPSPFRHPFNGTAPYFKIGNVTERFEAGYTGDHIKLDYERSWAHPPLTQAGPVRIESRGIRAGQRPLPLV